MTTILCVDDNADLVELLSELLKMMGYEAQDSTRVVRNVCGCSTKKDFTRTLSFSIS